MNLEVVAKRQTGLKEKREELAKARRVDQINQKKVGILLKPKVKYLVNIF